MEPSLVSGTVAFFRARVGVTTAVLLLSGWFLLATLLHLPMADAWAALGVEHEGPAFIDLAVITHSFDCVARGVNPYSTTACDPWGRIYNYPPVTLSLAALGVRSWHTIKLGLLIDAAFLVALVAILKARTVTGHLLMFVSVFSYPVLWGLERANTDLAVFVGCVVICLLLNRPSVLAYFASATIALVLFIGKLYPVVVCAAFWQNRRSVAASLFIASIAALTYIWLDPGMLRTVRELTPFTTWRSFGSGVLVGQGYLFLTASTTGILPQGIKTASYALSAAAVLAAAAVALLLRGRIAWLPGAGQRLAVRLAVTGLSVYCLTYCLGTNFNYRLIFLLLALPLFVDAWERYGRRPWLAMSFLTVALLLAKWQTHYGFYFRPRDWTALMSDLLAFGMFLAYAVGVLSYLFSLVTRPACR
jgi:hypothetical protein